MDADPLPEAVLAIDRLSDQLRDHPGDVSADRLWRAVFALDKWIFLTRSLEHPHPLIAEFGEGAMLLAFTTAQRAREGDEHAGLDANASSFQISIPLPEVVEWAAGFADHHDVHGILFDHPSQGYYLPLSSLLPIHQRILHSPPL